MFKNLENFVLAGLILCYLILIFISFNLTILSQAIIFILVLIISLFYKNRDIKKTFFLNILLGFGLGNCLYLLTKIDYSFISKLLDILNLDLFIRN
jgi:hypothetical protein